MSFYSKYLLLPTVVCRLRKNAKAGFISALKKISHISSFWKVLDVITAVRNGSIILGACSLESAADTITVILNLFLVSPLLFTTKKMPLNFWNGRNIKHCILRKKIQIEEHLCPLSSSNNNSHYNDGINTWRTEKTFLDLYRNAWFKDIHEQ